MSGYAPPEVRTYYLRDSRTFSAKIRENSIFALRSRRNVKLVFLSINARSVWVNHHSSGEKQGNLQI